MDWVREFSWKIGIELNLSFLYSLANNIKYFAFKCICEPHFDTSGYKLWILTYVSIACAISSSSPISSSLNGECAASQMLLSIHAPPSKPRSCRKASSGKYIGSRASPMSRLGRVPFHCRNSVTFVGNTKLNWSPRDIDSVLFGTGIGVWTATLNCGE